MNIFQTLDHIKKHRNHWYDIPTDMYSTGSFQVDSYQAGDRLLEFRNKWAKHGVVLKFKISEEPEMPVWDSMDLKMIVRPIIKVVMSNKENPRPFYLL